MVNAFRMGLDADSFDKRSLASLHSQQSLQNLRLQQAMKRSSSTNPGVSPLSADPDNSVLRSNSYPTEGDPARVWLELRPAVVNIILTKCEARSSVCWAYLHARFMCTLSVKNTKHAAKLLHVRTYLYMMYTSSFWASEN